MHDNELTIADPLGVHTPSQAEVIEARETLLKCAPELTLPYDDRKSPRVIPVETLNRIQKRVLKRR